MEVIRDSSAREPGASMKMKVIRTMHDVLRQRLLRRLESLPEAQLYQVLDYVEFLESKYGETVSAEVSGLQRLAENLEDRMRKKAMNPATLREAFQVIAAADRVLAGVSNAGKQLLGELVPEEGTGAGPSRGSESTQRGGASTDRGGASTDRGGASTDRGGASTDRGGTSTERGAASTDRTPPGSSSRPSDAASRPDRSTPDRPSSPGRGRGTGDDA